MSKAYWEKVTGENVPSSLELYPIIHKYLRGGYKILDIGCGFGKVSLELTALGYSVTGIDINREAIMLAKNAAESLSLDGRATGGVEFEVGDASKLPFPENEFDFAVMQAFLTSVPDPAERVRIMKEAYRVLKTGGYLYLVEFAQNWHLKLYRTRYLQDFPVTKEEGSFLARSPETGEIEFVAHHFSEKEFVFLLVDCGFEIDYFGIEECTTRTGNKINGFLVVAQKL